MLTNSIMKSKLALIVILLLVLSRCKSSSVSKHELISENKALRQRFARFETIDTSNINAVIEVSKMNVVYRGISNPVSINVANAIKVEASAPGLKKIDEFGNYAMVPTSGNHVDINVLGIMPNNDTITEIKRLRIKNIEKFRGTINGKGCGNNCEIFISKKELRNGKIKARTFDFLFDWPPMEIESYKIKFPKHEIVTVEGNQITSEINKIIDILAFGDKVEIFEIKFKLGSQALIRSPTDILIRIVED